MSTDRKNLSNSGTFKADIHGFKFEKFDGTTSFSRDPDNNLAIYAVHVISESTQLRFFAGFSPDIQDKRYELPNSAIFPPTLSEAWIDPHGDTHLTDYDTDKNTGHFTVEKYNKQTGEFKARFNVGILHEGRRHQAVGEIDIPGWTD